jgi:hypothetical protein
MPADGRSVRVLMSCMVFRYQLHIKRIPSLAMEWQWRRSGLMGSDIEHNKRGLMASPMARRIRTVVIWINLKMTGRWKTQHNIPTHFDWTVRGGDVNQNGGSTEKYTYYKSKCLTISRIMYIHFFNLAPLLVVGAMHGRAYRLSAVTHFDTAWRKQCWYALLRPTNRC